MIRTSEILQYKVFVIENKGVAICPLFSVTTDYGTNMGFWPKSMDHENPTLKYHNIYITEHKIPRYGDVIMDGDVPRRYSSTYVNVTKSHVVVATTDEEYVSILPDVDHDFAKMYATLWNAEHTVDTVSLLTEDGQIMGAKAVIIYYGCINRDAVDTKKPVRFYDDRSKDKSVYVLKEILYENEFLCLCSVDLSEDDKREVAERLVGLKEEKIKVVRAQQYEEAASIREKERRILDNMNMFKEGKISVALFNKLNGECMNDLFKFWYAENYE